MLAGDVEVDAAVATPILLVEADLTIVGFESPFVVSAEVLVEGAGAGVAADLAPSLVDEVCFTMGVGFADALEGMFAENWSAFSLTDGVCTGSCFAADCASCSSVEEPKLAGRLRGVGGNFLPLGESGGALLSKENYYEHQCILPSMHF